MKSMIVALLLCLPGVARSALVGQFNTGFEFEPVLARNFTDGYWMAGDQYRAWGLKDTAQTGSPTVFFVAGQYLHGINGGNQSVSLSLGIPVGTTAIAVINTVIQGLQADAGTLVIPPWILAAQNYTTVQIGGGYNALPEFSYIKPWFATFSLAVKIPIGAGATL